MGVVLEIPRAVFDAKAKREKARKAKAEKTTGRGLTSKEQNIRKGLLAKVHVAKCQIGMTDEEWRDFLRGRFDVDTSAALTVGALSALVGHLERLGWTPSTPKRTKDSHGKPHILKHDDAGMNRERQMGKIEALLSELGRIEGRYIPWSYAAAILKRQCGATRMEWADRDQLRDVIAALSRTLSRKQRGVHGRA